MANLTPAKRRHIRSVISSNRQLEDGLLKDFRTSFMIFGLFELMDVNDKETCSDLYRRTSWGSIKASFFGTANSLIVSLLMKNSSLRIKKFSTIGMFCASAAFYLKTPLRNNILFSKRLVDEGFLDNAIAKMNKLDEKDGFDSEPEIVESTSDSALN